MKTKSKPHPDYWKVKAAFLERSARVQQAEAAIQAADAAFSEVIEAAGLKADATYALSDADESITLQPKK